GAKRAFCRADQRMHSPFAAVGERDLFDVRVGPRAPDAASDRGRDGDCVGRTFERLGSNDDPRRGHTGMICILRDILTASDPVAIARDPESLARSWSELARRRAHPTVFLTPEWLAVARAHDPRERLRRERRAPRDLATARPARRLPGLPPKPHKEGAARAAAQDAAARKRPRGAVPLRRPERAF